MRKPDSERIEWLVRQQRLAQISSLRDAGFSRRRRSDQLRSTGGPERTTIIAVPERVIAERPEDRRRITDVFDSLLRALSNRRTRVKLDFSRTTKMYPGGMLMLLAYLELLLESHPGKITARCLPRSLSAQLLRHCGLADKLGVPPEHSTPTHASVVHWKYLTGTVADGTPIANLIEDYKRFGMAQIPEGLYEAITEALTNVRQHAYPARAAVPEILRRWWLFSKYESPQRDSPGNIYIGVYDIGVGIQSSMRAQLKPGEKLLDIAGQYLDWTGLEGTALLERLLLKAAVEGTRSGTGLDYRGNGLPEMRDFVLRTTSGSLSILSGTAQYTCMARTQTSTAVSSHPTLGTLIVWTIPLQPKEKAL
jgi:hypothetical protein